MNTATVIIASMLIISSFAQRSPYARRPIGYPEIEPSSTTQSSLENKFGAGETTTTQRLPIEALGNQELVNELSKLPQDQQPFWLLNWQALENFRQQPQTFEHSPNSFVDSMSFVGARNQAPNDASFVGQQRVPNFGSF